MSGRQSVPKKQVVVTDRSFRSRGILHTQGRTTPKNTLACHGFAHTMPQVGHYTMLSDRIWHMLEVCDSDDRVFPPTFLFNEGWVLRLVLDWFSRSGRSDHPFGFLPGAGWFSEGRLSSEFAPRHRGDTLAESWTHADAVIGHFDLDRGLIRVRSEATQLVVIEAKLFSRLSPSITNAAAYDQAARTVACIAAVLSSAPRPPR